MSTIKSDNSDLTINASGSTSDIKFQANGVEKASISSAGAFTSTKIDATKLTGNLPAISGASLTGMAGNTPYFTASIGVTQSLPDAVETKLNFSNEIHDSDGCYDPTTNYRFTPTTVGKYFITAYVLLDAGGTNKWHNGQLKIKKNGSGQEAQVWFDDYNNYAGYGKTLSISTIVDLNGSSDYVELYGYFNVTSGTGNATANESRFLAFKLG